MMKIRRLIVVLIVAIASIACTGNSNENKYFVTQQGDSIPMSRLIGPTNVGLIPRGATVARLNRVYGENYVKQLKDPAQDMAKVDSNSMGVYYVYDQDNQLQLVARTVKSIGDPDIRSLVIKDDKFTTEKGITLSSTVDQLRAAYPDAMVVQYENRTFVYISSLDLYLRIDESNIRGYDPEFLADISLDSLRGDARFEQIAVSWNVNNTNVLTPQFWRDLLAKVLKWLFYELPVILFLVLLFVLLKRLLDFSFAKINTVARKRVEADESLDSSEAVKRVDTITGILHGILDILLWSIFILIILSKFGINIAPILASAGILGLAVGFGAQELVRDFICGFFILLEDQIRTGDMAIINNTTGVVEKIELRTVTLRDPSGVVHIFQNGKINSLSNMTKEWSAIVLEIGVAYKEDIDQVIEIMKQVGAELRAGEMGHMMLEDIEVWGLDAFADSSVVIKMSIKTRPMKQWRIKREYLRLLKMRFDADGVEIPFPHVTIYTGENTKPMPLEVKREKEVD